MVEYIDGSVLAQLGSPDMRTPIAYSLAWPDRLAVPVPRLDLAQIGSLTFENPDIIKFPAIGLAREVLKMGAAAATTMNAANEVAVHGFLAGRIGFLDIVSVVEETLERSKLGDIASLGEVVEIDGEAREIANALIVSTGSGT